MSNKIIKNRLNYLKSLLCEYQTLEGLGISSLLTLYNTGDFSIFAYNIILLSAIIKDLVLIRKKADVYGLNLESKENQKNEKYTKLKKEYDKYVDLLAKYTKYQGFSDPLDIAIFYMIMLYNGELSVTDEFKFKDNNKNDDCRFYSTLGSRVVSGYGVCRHTASLLNDVYKRLGCESYYLTVKSYRNKNLFSFIKDMLDRETHAVVLVNSKEGSFIIDPTWETFSTILSNYYGTTKMIDGCGNDYKTVYRFLGYYDDSIYSLIDSDTEFKKNKTRKITEQDIFSSYCRVKNIIEVNSYKGEFKDYCIDLMENIKKLECDLNISDEEKVKVR